jgi:hypothetical protein
MRSSLPILMLLAMCVRTSTLAGADSPTSDLTPGNQLVQNAAETLVKQPALEAKVRQRATMFGQLVSGAGFYLQLRDADRILLRYDFKLQVADQRTSLLQVNDGTTLWLRRDYGQLQSQAYVHVRRLREAKQQLRGEPPAVVDFAPELALGGLSEILCNLDRNFHFDQPQPIELKGIPVWELTGSWKPERLAQIAPTSVVHHPSGDTINAAALPAQLPDAVKLVLGRDAKIPLFPYRITFGRHHRGDSVAGISNVTPPAIDPLVTIELYEVRRRPDLTPADFAFQPSDQNVEDRTELYLRKLGLAKTE